MTGLRKRCWEFLKDGECPDPDDLMDFVQAEIGRAASETLDGAAPLVLYFGTDEDRKEFFDLIMTAKPGMISRKWP